MRLPPLLIVHLHERRIADNLPTRRLSSALAVGRAYGEGDTGRTMSQENVEIVRRSLDAFSRGVCIAEVRSTQPPLEAYERLLLAALVTRRGR